MAPKRNNLIRHFYNHMLPETWKFLSTQTAFCSVCSFPPEKEILCVPGIEIQEIVPRPRAGVREINSPGVGERSPPNAGNKIAGAGERNSRASEK